EVGPRPQHPEDRLRRHIDELAHDGIGIDGLRRAVDERIPQQPPSHLRALPVRLAVFHRVPFLGSPRTAGPPPHDVLRLALPLLLGSPRTAGPPPHDVLRLALPLFLGSPRTAGTPAPRRPAARTASFLRLASDGGPPPHDVLRLALPFFGSPRTGRQGRHD